MPPQAMHASGRMSPGGWILLLALALATAAHAQDRIYKWVDENGKVRYTDHPPPGANQSARQIKVPDAPPPSGPNPYLSSPAEQSLRQQNELMKAQREAQEREHRAQLQMRCAQARQRLAALDSGRRLYRTEADGARNFMDDADIANQREVQSQAIAAYCDN